MIDIKTGNLMQSACPALVNPVNCVGVMGKELALEFKEKFPEMFADYKDKCQMHLVHPGEPYVYVTKMRIKIVNFPTKDHWRNPSRLPYIEEGLDWFVDNYQKYRIASVAFPALGCGNGGLPWRVVAQLMIEKLEDLPIKIDIYAPYGSYGEDLSIDFLRKTGGIGKKGG